MHLDRGLESVSQVRKSAAPPAKTAPLSLAQGAAADGALHLFIARTSDFDEPNAGNQTSGGLMDRRPRDRLVHLNAAGLPPIASRD
jgi:hypothetical protein